LTGNRGFLEKSAVFFRILFPRCPDQSDCAAKWTCIHWLAHASGLEQPWFSFLTSERKHHFKTFVKQVFYKEKIRFLRLVAQRGGGKLISKYEQPITDGHVRVVRDKSLRSQRSCAAGHGAVQQVRTFDYGTDAVAAI
jgi:membrane-anchored protein YejM (alkaline phosphatase superfamily)